MQMQPASAHVQVTATSTSAERLQTVDSLGRLGRHGSDRRSRRATSTLPRGKFTPFGVSMHRLGCRKYCVFLPGVLPIDKLQIQVA